MQLPVDVKAVIEEATNIDAARNTPLSVSVYIDETAPGDVVARVRSAFASATAQARVSLTYLDGRPFSAYAGDDMAVIVAGLSENIGAYAEDLRRAGVPVMLATTMPSLVREIAEAKGHPIPEADLVSPDEQSAAVRALPWKTGQAFKKEAAAGTEPCVLDEEAGAAFDNRMGEWIIEACHDKRLAFALAFPFVRRPLSTDAVNATAIQNAGVGLVVFIPGADMPIMTLNQAKMLLQIAAAYGEPLNVDRVKELAAVIGGGFACRAVARQIVAFVPALGWIVKAAIGYTGTVAIGRAAIEYFENGGNIAGLAGVVNTVRTKVIEIASDARALATGEAPVSQGVAGSRGKASQVKAAAAHKVKGAARSAADGVVPFAASVVNAGAQAAGVDTDFLAKTAVQSIADAAKARLKGSHS